MTWIILQLLFPILLWVLPMRLYRSGHRLMARFRLGMTASANARKLYGQLLLIILLVFHYIYAGGHRGDFGILISTILCTLLFSGKRMEKWLGYLREHRKTFVVTSLSALAFASLPHLYTLSVTLAFLLLAASFYPSRKVLSGWEDEETRNHWRTNPEALSEQYHSYHHAVLP